jgi:hypothetical protein
MLSTASDAILVAVEEFTGSFHALLSIEKKNKKTDFLYYPLWPSS